jgi:hypothetical protein
MSKNSKNKERERIEYNSQIKLVVTQKITNRVWVTVACRSVEWSSGQLKAFILLNILLLNIQPGHENLNVH